MTTRPGTYDAVEELSDVTGPRPDTSQPGGRDFGRTGVSQLAQRMHLPHLPAVVVGAARFATAGSASLTECDMAAEVRVNKVELTNLTQLVVHSFTHTPGAYDRRTRDAVVGAGYRSAAALRNARSPGPTTCLPSPAGR